MTRRLSALLLAGFIYLLMVSGGVLPIGDDPVKAVVKGFALLVALFAVPLGPIRLSTLRVLAWFCAIGSIFVCFAFFQSTNYVYAIEKVDGAIICPCILVILLDRGYEKFSELQFQASFLICAFGILLLTVAYKLHYGFFDRQVRFLLNGPIVYGWLMGFSGVLALHLWTTTRNIFWLSLLVIFAGALLWTESKGSTVAFIAAFISYVLMTFRRNTKFILIGLVLAAAIYIVFLDEIMNVLADSRLSTIGRLFSGEFSQADDGSVGARTELLRYAVARFEASPFFGIGLGEFSFDSFVYPHNQHLEIFLELGLFAGLAHILFAAFSYLRANALNRSVLLLFVVASAFSGDASYLRFLYAFCLLALVRYKRGSSVASLAHPIALRAL